MLLTKNSNRIKRLFLSIDTKVTGEQFSQILVKTTGVFFVLNSNKTSRSYNISLIFDFWLFRNSSCNISAIRNKKIPGTKFLPSIQISTFGSNTFPENALQVP